jgi:asparagine synthase (glutamine-hydrolysing)
MCGIFGVLTPDTPVNVEACFEGLSTLHHRGPDGKGTLVVRLRDRWHRAVFQQPGETDLSELAAEAPDVLLGHTRLAILDLSSSADQPMTNEDGTIWVVFNGEIYNHLELRKLLEGRGHIFRTDHSDTEVLVHGYEEWGEGLVDRLRGMFAFAILSLRNHTLFLARDRFGEKPLYLSANAGGIAFASELKALLASGTIGRDICPSALRDYLGHGYIPAPRSIFQGVVKLAAAQLATIDLAHPDRFCPRTYWRPSCWLDHGLSDSQVLEDFERVLHESIALRMQSDVPLGAFLSGGLDSTTVVRHMVGSSSRRVRTFNIGFNHSRYNEAPYADEVARRYQTEHYTQVLEPDEMLSALQIVERQYDEPFADSSSIPTYLVSKMARRHVTVALSGDGGDELLCGYRHHQLLHWIGLALSPFPRVARKGISQTLRGVWPQTNRAYGLIKMLDADEDARFMRVFTDDYFLRRIPFEDGNLAGDTLRQVWNEIPGSGVEKIAAVDSQFYVPEDLMVKTDRASMAVSLEARAPLLDHHLFEAAARIPLRLRFDGKVGKLPFRTTLTTDLGARFVNRPKWGFGVPLGRWFRDQLRDQLHDTLYDPAGLVGDLLPRGEIDKLIAMHINGSCDQSGRLWRLFALQRWHAIFGRARPAFAA